MPAIGERRTGKKTGRTLEWDGTQWVYADDGSAKADRVGASIQQPVDQKPTDSLFGNILGGLTPREVTRASDPAPVTVGPVSGRVAFIPYADKPWPMAKKSYAAQVHRLDQDLGHLRALLESLGIARRTLIIFLSDNGATFLRSAEHDGTNVIGRWFNGTLNYRGFKGDPYEGGLRVPGIAAWPGRIKPGGTSAVRADFTDVHATVVEAAGLPAPKNFDGRSILPALVGKGSVKLRDYFVWFSPDRNQSAVLFGGWKGVLMRDTLRLFNVTRVPGETKDLSHLEPDVVRRLTETW